MFGLFLMIQIKFVIYSTLFFCIHLYIIDLKLYIILKYYLRFIINLYNLLLIDTKKYNKLIMSEYKQSFKKIYNYVNYMIKNS